MIIRRIIVTKHPFNNKRNRNTPIFSNISSAIVTIIIINITNTITNTIIIIIIIDIAVANLFNYTLVISYWGI
jgi:hypothetical protein